eukprot:TRINITY_DN24973_c0_g1_i1.p2 TRINITY_DN24973_c0_g1~~TRINITY_DN24973_c0_g1_i1.p2  ORF type:complete len:638 (+),score=254.45 TRINITY_DN24973_c0_g1_i1:50-1963(+)
MADTPAAPKGDAPAPAAQDRGAGICKVKTDFYKDTAQWAGCIGPAATRAKDQYKAEVIPLAAELVQAAAAEAAAAEAAAAAPTEAPAAGEKNEHGKRPLEGEALETEPASKRAKGARGQNKGKSRRLHAIENTVRLPPSWDGEKNFLPPGYPKTKRRLLAGLRTMKNWKCSSCGHSNNSRYNLYSCYKCGKLVDKEEAKQCRGDSARQQLLAQLDMMAEEPAVETKPLPEAGADAAPINEVKRGLFDASIEPATAGWYEPRAKKALDFAGKTYLSPLTTVGNLPFRRVCTNFGVDITCSEMACVDNLNRFQSSEWSLLRKHESERMFGLQVAASHPTEAGVFAKLLAEVGYDYSFIDVNCGCPIDCICNKGMGSALGEPHLQPRLKGIVSGLHFQANPVTIKVRVGKDERSPTLHNWIGEIDQWGVSAITIHGRSRRQRYTRSANWDYISKCAGLSPVPVVGNGDLLDYTQWNDHMGTKGVKAIMSGRGALIKPWLFTEIKEQRHWDISSHERFNMLKDFTQYGLDHWGADTRGRASTRKFLCEWLGFLHRYVPVGLLERVPQVVGERPQLFQGRDDLETLFGSDRSDDWVKITELLLGPVEKGFKFVPKHKSSSYAVDKDGNMVAMTDEGGTINEE